MPTNPLPWGGHEKAEKVPPGSQNAPKPGTRYNPPKAINHGGDGGKQAPGIHDSLRK